MANGLARPQNLKPELEAIIGKGPMSRPQVMQKLWVFIKTEKLQDGRNILAGKDPRMAKVFGDKTITMFELAKLVSPYLSPA